MRQISNQIYRRHENGAVGFVSERTPESVRKKCRREGWTKANCANYATSNPVSQKWDTIKRLQAKYKTQQEDNTRGVMADTRAMKKILCLSDFHFPLARTDDIRAAIELHSDADIFVANGDILEGYIFSTFAKHSTIAALDEYRIAFNFVNYLRETFPQVVLISGNHDARTSRSLKAAGYGSSATKVLRPDLLARIANGERLDATGLLKEKLDFSNVHYNPNESWYAKIGKTVFIHPHGRGSSYPGYIVRKAADKMMLRYSASEVDSFVCGHTHQIYKGIYNGQLLIEQGCMAGLMSYSWSPNMKYGGNAMCGYAVIYQDEEGNTDFNKSGPIYVGNTTPPKKADIL